MTYEERVAYIMAIPKFTKKNAPSHTAEFLKRLGNPQEDFAVIHVAGSNGKGSVCAFINNVLVKSGIHTGLFTSPHLVDIRERFLVDGGMCSKQEFLQAEAVVHQEVLRMVEDGLAHPTFFEYLFAVAMVLFRRAGVTCAVLETGMGGRLDATNVVTAPLLTVITSISLEHTEILGDTIEKIAGEKAGIIKPGVLVIYDGNEPAAERVILQAAREKQAPAQGIYKKNINILLKDGKHIDFSVESGYDVTRAKIPFPAEYQVMNGALALAAVNEIKHQLPITKEGIKRGFEEVCWPGRMEEIRREVYLDGAHNTSGISVFLQAVEEIADMPGILLFSMVKEKDYKKAVQQLCRQGNWKEIILTQISDNKRALELELLTEAFYQELDSAVVLKAIKEPKEAFAQALADKEPGQKVFCAGSLYLVGELKKITGGYHHD